jgi:hypothetical protein
MTFELLCVTLLTLWFGAMVCFGGYRLFLLLLPVWGFFFGFALGAQSIQLLFGEAFLATATSWVVGFIMALLFAVLAYLFYAFAVALIAGSLGYGLGVAVMGIFSADLTILTWLVGMALAIGFIVITFRFSLAKYMIIVATSLVGAALITATLVVGANAIPLLSLAENPVRLMLEGHFMWSLFFLLLAGAGIALQIMLNRQWEIETYNRWAEIPIQSQPQYPQ